jgi:hypothetical protein
VLGCEVCSVSFARIVAFHLHQLARFAVCKDAAL